MVKTLSFTMQGPWIGSLIGELRSHIPQGAAKKKSPNRLLVLCGQLQQARDRCSVLLLVGGSVSVCIVGGDGVGHGAHLILTEN